MNDLNAYRAAKLRLDSKGIATAHARQRIADLTAEGDVAGRATWFRIASAMAVLKAGVPEADGQRVQ